ncbi:MAG: hypothetical protein RI924_65 [Bacteroidota bacterium]|jgi:gas vesicle protein
MSDNSKIVVALLAGVAVGAALGILFAPDSGSETRDKLSRSLKDLGERIQDLASDGMEDLSETAEKVSNTVKSKIKKTQDTFNEAGNQAGV